MKFNERLRIAIKSRNISQAELAKTMEVSHQYVNNYFNGSRDPSMKIIKKFADALNLPLYYFVSDAVPNDPRNYEKMVKLPVIGRIPAGQPIEAVQDYVGEILIPEEMMKRFPGNHFALRVICDSMSPVISTGDTVVVCQYPEYNNGDLVAARLDLDENVVLKYFHRQSENIVILKPANPSFEPIVIWPSGTARMSSTGF